MFIPLEIIGEIFNFIKNSKYIFLIMKTCKYYYNEIPKSNFCKCNNIYFTVSSVPDKEYYFTNIKIKHSLKEEICVKIIKKFPKLINLKIYNISYITNNSIKLSNKIPLINLNLL